MKKVILVSNKNKDNFLIKTDTIKEYLTNNNFEVFIAEDYIDEFGNYRYKCNEQNSDLVIAIGGDGTYLQAVNDFKHIKNVKFFGINTGHLGYLTSLEFDDFIDGINKIINNEYKIKSYNLLNVECRKYDYKDECLNDIVIGRKGFARIIEIEVFINGISLYKFSGDGILISTDVGSTAYNLSLGGPIIYPSSNVLSIVPIAPHGLTTKPIIVPADSQIDIKIIGGHKKTNQEALLTCDGRNNNISLISNDVIKINSNNKINAIELLGFNYFNNLKEKLK